MADNTPQTYANHARFHPLFHFFAAPLSFLILILAIVNAVRHYQRLDAWILLLIGILLPVALVLVRTNSLRVQDRLIRLEERLRLQALLPPDLLPRIPDLSERQLIALRFASDAELSSLVTKVLASNMAPKDIKQSIVTWRADTFRV